MSPRHPLAPLPRDLADGSRCERSGLRYFEQAEVTVREAPDSVACPGCGRTVTLRESKWGIALIPRHRKWAPPD